MNEQDILKNQLQTDIIEWVKDYNSFRETSIDEVSEVLEQANNLVEKFARYIK